MIDFNNPNRPWWHKPLHTAINSLVIWVYGAIIAVGIPLMILNAIGVI